MKKWLLALLIVVGPAVGTASAQTPWMRKYPDVSWKYLEKWEKTHLWLAPFREGRRLFYEGELDAALEHLEQAVAEQDQDGRLHYEIGYIHYVRGETAAAVKRLERAAVLLARDMPAHEYLFNSFYLLGRIAETEQRLQDALGHYSSALRLAPNEAALHYRRGLINRQLNHREEARRDLARAVEIDPGLGSADYLMGLFSLEAGELAMATRYFQNAIDKGTEEASAFFCLGEIAAREERWETAVGHFRSALEKDPQLLPARIALANTLYLQGDIGGAENEFRRLSEMEPGQARWVYNLGVIYREQGKEELSVEHFRRAFEINPELDFYYRPSEETEALTGAAYRKYQEGDYRGAIDLYRQALLNDAFYLPARFNLARAYQADKQAGRARREYERLLRADPDNIPTHLNLGIILYQQDRRSPRAAYHLRRYLELNPQSRQAHLIRLYLREIRDW